MNPLNQHSQSSGYMGLLHRQQSGALHENSPYESFHSEASDFPQFSSQQGEAPTPPSDTPVERGKRHRWSPADDKLLISASRLRIQLCQITKRLGRSGSE